MKVASSHILIFQSAILLMTLEALIRIAVMYFSHTAQKKLSPENTLTCYMDANPFN